MFTLRETGERLNHRQAQNMLGISFPRDNLDRYYITETYYVSEYTEYTEYTA